MRINIFQFSHICGLLILFMITIELLFFKHLTFLFQYKVSDLGKANRLRIALGIMTLVVFLLGLINVITKWSQINSWRIDL